MVSPYLSRKFQVLSFITIYLVVVIHTYFPDAEHFAMFNLFQRFFNFYFCNLFLPLFFMMSGFLFYVNIRESNFTVWRVKFKSRIKSLLIPYIIWNLFFLIEMVVLQLLPHTKNWFNSDIIQIYFSDSLIDAIWLIFSNPINFPLWFIGHLILIIPFTPIIWTIVKSRFWIIPVFVGFIFSWKFNIALSFFFYYIGAVLSIREVNIEFKIKSKLIFSLLILTIMIGGAISYGMILPNRSLLFYLCIIPMLLLWFGYDKFVALGFKFKLLDAFIPYTFFIYVFHEPHLNIFKKIIVKIGDFSNLSYWIGYVFSPLLIVLLAFLIGKIWSRISPRTYSVVVGNRG